MSTGNHLNKPTKAPPATSVRKTAKIDAGVASFEKLTETGKTLSEASKVLSGAHAVLANPTSSQAQKRKAMDELATVSKFLRQSSSDINKNLKKLSPFPGVDNRALAIIDKVKQENTPRNTEVPCTSIGKIQAMIHDRSITTKKKPAPPSVAARNSTTKESPNSLAPPPSNGSIYDRRECVTVVTSFKKNSRERGQVVQEILKQKFVPVSRSRLHKLVKQFEDHVDAGGTLNTFPNDEWHVKKGRAPYLSAQAVQESTPINPERPSTPIAKLQAIIPDSPIMTTTTPPQVIPAPPSVVARNSTGTAKESSNSVIAPPRPSNGSIYDRRELITVVTSFKKNSRERGQVVQEILKQKFVPVGRSGLHKVVKQFEDHVDAGGTLDTFPNDDWHLKKGRDAYLSAQSVQEIVDDMAAHPGKSFSQEEITSMLQEKKKEELAREGIVAPQESVIASCRNTMKRYAQAIAGMNQKRSVKKLG